MIAALAILKPKLVPGERLVKNDSVSFCLSACLERLRLGDGCRTAGRGGDERHGILVVEFEVDEIFRIGDAQSGELGERARGS